MTVKVPVVERANDTGELEALVSTQQAIRPLGVIALDLNPSVAALLPSIRRQTRRRRRARDCRIAILTAGTAAGRAT